MNEWIFLIPLIILLAGVLFAQTYWVARGSISERALTAGKRSASDIGRYMILAVVAATVTSQAEPMARLLDAPNVADAIAQHRFFLLFIAFTIGSLVAHRLIPGTPPP